MILKKILLITFLLAFMGIFSQTFSPTTAEKHFVYCLCDFRVIFIQQMASIMHSLKRHFLLDIFALISHRKAILHLKSKHETDFFLMESQVRESKTRNLEHATLAKPSQSETIAL